MVYGLPSGGFAKRFPCSDRKAHGWAHGTRTRKGRNEVENLKRSEAERRLRGRAAVRRWKRKGVEKGFGGSGSGRRSRTYLDEDRREHEKIRRGIVNEGINEDSTYNTSLLLSRSFKIFGKECA